MSINIISKLKPKNSGSFPIYEDVDVEGGFQIRADSTDRDSIPILNRKEGMLVYLVADGYFCQLGSGLTNGDWYQVDFAGTLAGDVTGSTGSNIVEQLTGLSNKVKILANNLSWDENNIAILKQDDLTNNLVVPTDLNIQSQAPEPTAGILTGKPGNINLLVPPAVGGASEGTINFFIGSNNPLQLTDSNVYYEGQFTPSIGQTIDEGFIERDLTFESSPYTLTNLEKINKIIKFTGTRGSAISIYIDEVEGNWHHIINQTNVTLDIRTVSYTGVNVSASSASTVLFTGNSVIGTGGGGGGTLVGDVTGAIGSNTVEKIRGVNIDPTAPSTGSLLGYNGTSWIRTNPPIFGGSALTYSGGSWNWTLPTGDLSGTYASTTVAKINGVTLSGTPSSGQVLTATGASTASWQTAASSGPAGDNGIVNRATNKATLQGFVHRNIYYTTAESFTAITDTADGFILALKAGRYVKLHDGISGVPANLNSTSASPVIVDLTTTDFTQVLYIGTRQRQHSFTQQFCFASGASGYRRIEFKFNTTGAITNTNNTYAVRAMVYDGNNLYLWDQTNGKIIKISNPNADRLTAMIESDLTTNGSVPVASATGKASLMTFDGTNIWCIDGNKLFKIVVSTGTVTSYTFSIAGTGRAVFFDGKWLWVSTSSALRRVDPTDADPANNGTAISGSISTNISWGDILSSDGELIYAARTNVSSASFSVGVIDPDTCYVVQEFQGPDLPSGMVSTGSGAMRRVSICTTGSTGNGFLWRIDKESNLQVQTLKTTGARFLNQKTAVTYGSTYYVQPDDHIIPVTTNGGLSSGAVTINLPVMGASTYLSQGSARGRELIIYDMDGAAATIGNTITINAGAGDTINGVASTTITTNYGAIRLYWTVNPFGVDAKWVKI